MIIDIISGLNRTAFSGGINIVDVRDVAKGHILAAEKGKTGERYILGNKNVAISEFMKMVYKAHTGNEKIFIPKVPTSLLKGGTYALSLWADRISKKPPLSTPVEVSYASNYLYVDNTKAKKELGLKFQPVEESIKDAIEWFKANKMI